MIGPLVTVEFWALDKDTLRRAAVGLRLDLDKRVFLDKTGDSRLDSVLVTAAEALTDYIIANRR